MAKTIKVIDLLNKIANGEELPIEVKWKNHIYKFNGLAYISVKSYSDNFYCLGYMHGEGNLLNCLNDTVEIIEEQQDIKAIETLNPEEVYFKDGTELVYKLMYDKINELAMKVNKQSREINKLKE